MKYANPSRKTKVIATRAGVSIEFPGMTDGKPVFVHVPAQARREIHEAGMLPEDEAGFNDEGNDGGANDTKAAKKAAGAMPDDPVELKRVLFEAFKQLVAADDSSLFTAGGMPKDKALEKIVGFEVDNATRKEAWGEFMQATKAAE